MTGTTRTVSRLRLTAHHAGHLAVRLMRLLGLAVLLALALLVALVLLLGAPTPMHRAAAGTSYGTAGQTQPQAFIPCRSDPILTIKDDSGALVRLRAVATYRTPDGRPLPVLFTVQVPRTARVLRVWTDSALERVRIVHEGRGVDGQGYHVTARALSGTLSLTVRTSLTRVQPDPSQWTGLHWDGATR